MYIANVKATTLSSDLKERIRADIACGGLAPSEPLKMEALKARFDAGFSPIREALSQLVAEGLVDLSPNRGFRVAALSRDDLLDIAIARIAVETAAVRRAIERGDERWEASVVGAMHLYRRLSDDPFASAEALGAWECAHDGLHAAIISACESPRLIAMQARYQEQHLRYRRLVVVPHVAGAVHATEHERLVDLVIGRQADAAAQAIERHMMITVEALAEAGIWAS